jgi:hypothetical protein
VSDEMLVLPCGCVVTHGYGHVHTRLCAKHKRELFEKNTKPDPAEDNLDLVGE